MAVYDAIVLAGGAADPPEALLDIGGRPMLSYVLAALAASRSVGRIIVAGPPLLAKLPLPERTVLTAGGAGVLDTLAAGLRAAGEPERALIATADIPFLTAAAVDDFAARCGAADDFCYSVVERPRLRARFPGARRTYVRLRDGAFTGGNLFLARARILPRCRALASRVADNRKRPWRLAAMLGWANLLKFACGRLSLEEARLAAGRALGIRVGVVCSPYAELGMDVDKSADLALAREFFHSRRED